MHFPVNFAVTRREKLGLELTFAVYLQTKRSPDLITDVLKHPLMPHPPWNGAEGSKWLRTEIKVHATGGNVNWISADGWLRAGV